MGGQNEGCFAGSAFPKPVLAVCEYSYVVKVFHYVAVDYVLENLADNTCQRGRSVVGRLRCIPFL